jgi:hypothetical protein
MLRLILLAGVSVSATIFLYLLWNITDYQSPVKKIRCVSIDSCKGNAWSG